MKIIRTRSFSDNTVDFKEIIGDLVGMQVKCKALHWSSPSKNIHQYLDELYEKLGDYIDELAETVMGIEGMFGPCDIQCPNYDHQNALEFIESLQDKVEHVIEGISEDVQWSGVKSITEDFLQMVNQYKYLFSMTNESGEFGKPQG